MAFQWVKPARAMLISARIEWGFTRHAPNALHSPAGAWVRVRVRVRLALNSSELALATSTGWLKLKSARARAEPN